MRPYVIAVVFTALFCSQGFGQPQLRSSIGIHERPKDTDSLCTPGPYGSNFYDVGPRVGEHAFDFTLFDAAGDSLSLAEILSRGKPALLISGSYTCTVFRKNVPTINDVVARYGSKVSVYVIYTVEAHPIVDKSPYGDGDAYSDELNAIEGIQYPQSRTYGERKAMDSTMLANLPVSASILLDAPCNQWLEAYGPAPNIGYLIDQTGLIRYKEPWFDLDGSNIYSDLDELLSIDTSRASNDTGRFTFELQSNDTIIAPVGSTPYVDGKLVNATDAPAIVRIARHNGRTMPTGWKSAICTNVCLSPSEDTAIVRVEAHSQEDLRIYFYLDSNTGTGPVYVHLYNDNVPDDSLHLRFVCVATTTDAAVSAPSSTMSAPILCVPNPVSSTWAIRTTIPYRSLRLYDALGRRCADLPAADRYSASTLAGGTYRVELLDDGGNVLGRAVLVRQ